LSKFELGKIKILHSQKRPTSNDYDFSEATIYLVTFYQIASFLAMAWPLYRRPILQIGSYSQLL